MYKKDVKIQFVFYNIDYVRVLVSMKEDKIKNPKMLMFQSEIVQFITAAYKSICEKKKAENSSFEYSDAQYITSAVKKVFTDKCGELPNLIDAACNISLAVIAPDKKEKIRLLKLASSGVGTVAGVGLILGSVLTVIGAASAHVSWWAALWGASATIPVVGPAIGAAGGVTLLGVASYFIFHKESKEKIAEKFFNSLIKSISKAVEQLWENQEYKDKLISN